MQQLSSHHWNSCSHYVDVVLELIQKDINALIVELKKNPVYREGKQSLVRLKLKMNASMTEFFISLSCLIDIIVVVLVIILVVFILSTRVSNLILYFQNQYF